MPSGTRGGIHIMIHRHLSFLGWAAALISTCVNSIPTPVCVFVLPQCVFFYALPPPASLCEKESFLYLLPRDSGGVI